MSLSVVTTEDLKQTEQRLSDEFDSKIRMMIEILNEGPTLEVDRCAELMHVKRRTALKRLRQAGIKMNEDVKPKVVDSKDFYEALWEGRIKS